VAERVEERCRNSISPAGKVERSLAPTFFVHDLAMQSVREAILPLPGRKGPPSIPAKEERRGSIHLNQERRGEDEVERRKKGGIRASIEMQCEASFLPSSLHPVEIMHFLRALAVSARMTASLALLSAGQEGKPHLVCPSDRAAKFLNGVQIGPSRTNWGRKE